MLAAVALTGCETTQEKSAKLEKVAKQEAKHRALAHRGLTITHESTKVKVLATAVLDTAEATAAIVTVRNLSSTALSHVPIQITVRSSGGAPAYTNNVPGLATPLVSVPLVPAHGVVTWVNDQVPAGGNPKSVSARLGEGEPATGAVPRLSVEGTSVSSGSGSEAQAEGSVVNHSSTEQHEVAVYAIARRAGRIVAAGSAVLPQAPAGASTHFQLYFTGDPRGARVSFSADAAAA